MKRLIINTANDELWITLQLNEELFSYVGEKNAHHNEEMLPQIDKLLRENKVDIKDVDEFGVVIGPGSFTGIRVGISTIKAFSDSLKRKVKGINNLDLLFCLSVAQNPEIETVAILGSRNSYFVARKIHGILYKYERNLSLEELKKVANGKKIGMFKQDENVDSFVVKLDDKILAKCFEESSIDRLNPVYYQLSQAENEKLKRGELKILKSELSDLDEIYEIEVNSVEAGRLSKSNLKEIFEDDSYVVYKAVLDNTLAGFIILQQTDEINIVNVAVKREMRNMGIGTKLIETAENLCREKGVKTLSLEVGVNNITAFLLYEKVGFATRRIRKNYYQDKSDCVEMVKNVQL